MNSLLEIMGDGKRAGLYLSQIAEGEVAAAAKTADLEFFRVNLGLARDKNDLLRRLAQVLELPSYFGGNWDALHDCLSDSSSRSNRGWLLLLQRADEFAGREPQDFDTLIEVLESAAAAWRTQGKAFWILLEGRKDWGIELPKLLPA